MALSATAVSGGVLIRGAPIGASLFCTTDVAVALPDADPVTDLHITHIDITSLSTLPALGIVGATAFVPTTGAGGVFTAGTTLYVSETRNTPIAQAEVMIDMPPFIEDFQTAEAVTDLDTVNVSSGQTRVDFDAPLATGTLDDILRYCVTYGTGEWGERDAFVGVNGLLSPVNAAPGAGLGALNDFVVESDTRLWRKSGVGSRIASRDIDLINSSWSWQGGVSDGTTIWFVNNTAKTAVAYVAATGERDATKDISFGAGGTWVGGASDGTTLWFADNASRTFRAYIAATQARDSTKDITTTSGAWEGATSDGTTLWFWNRSSRTAVAYAAADQSRDSGKDISIGGSDNYRGLVSDGTTIWFVNDTDDTAEAYTAATQAADTSRDIDLGTGGWYGGAAVGDVLWFLRGANGRTAEARSTLPWTVALEAPVGSVIRTVDDTPGAALGNLDDYAIRLDGTDIDVWQRELAAPTTVDAYSSGQTLTDLVNDTEYDLKVEPLTFAGLGDAAVAKFTPAAVADAPARRNVRAINGHGEVLTVWDKPDDVRSVDVEYRPAEIDAMGHVEGHQMVVQDFNGQRYSVRGLPMGSEARVRVNAKRNPETESAEAVVPRVGISTSGLPIPPGCYDEPPDAEFVWACQQNLRPTASGANAGAKGLYYNDWQRYQQVAARIEDPSEWVSGRSYYVGADVFVYQTVHSTTGTFEFQQGAECILDHEAATDRTRPYTGEDWRRYWRAKPIIAALDPADAPDIPAPTEVEPDTPGDPDTTPEPAHLSSATYNNVEAAGGNVFDRRADNQGEIQFGAFIDGSYRHNGRSWERAKRQTDLLTLSISDMNGADQQVLLFSAFPGAYVTVRESAGRWIRYLIEAVRPSLNGLRANFQVKPDDFAESAGAHDFTGSETLEIRFSFAAPMEMVTQGATKKPKRVGALAKTGSTADSLTIGITAPVSDDTNDAATRYFYRYIDRNLPSPRWSHPTTAIGDGMPMPFVRMAEFTLTGLTIDYDVDVQVWAWNEGGHSGFRGLNDLVHA